MKTAGQVCALVALLLTTTLASAEEVYTSTFSFTSAHFHLTGFSEDQGGTVVPSTGPDYLDIDGVQGTYDMNIPPAGTTWDVLVSGSIEVDYDADGTWDLSATVSPPYPAGNFESPGPITSAAGTFPYTFLWEGASYDFSVDYAVDLDGPYPAGPFGPNAFATLTVTGDDAGMLMGNEFLTGIDDGDGILDGYFRGDVTVTCIPEPAALALLALGAVYLIGRMSVVDHG